MNRSDISIGDIVIRAEREGDRREVENLIREAFWNVYRPGCCEHYLITVLRGDPAFVRELDLVMEAGGRIIGQNVFAEAVIEADSGENVKVLTMGPICVSPEVPWDKRCRPFLSHSRCPPAPFPLRPSSAPLPPQTLS